MENRMVVSIARAGLTASKIPRKGTQQIVSSPFPALWLEGRCSRCVPDVLLPYETHSTLDCYPFVHSHFRPHVLCGLL